MTGPVDLDAIVRWFDDLERMGLPAKSVRALVAEVEALRGENGRLRDLIGALPCDYPRLCGGSHRICPPCLARAEVVALGWDEA